VEFKPGDKAAAVKCVSLSEDFLRDHFPGRPVMPGVLLLEGMAQLSGTLLSETVKGETGRKVMAIMTIADKAKFRKFVFPGDTIRYGTRIISFNELGGKAKAKAHVNEELVADSVLTFVFHELTDPQLLKAHSDQISMWLYDPRSNEPG
jgi:3-hydroxyacyl-[acyl-carrier-protein] dehydratase